MDLVELDPPFNSNRDDNVTFGDESGNATDAQLLAFKDTWHWELNTVLLTVEETIVALQKASSIRYRLPGDEG